MPEWGGWRLVFLYAAGAYLTAMIILWLRVWGSYIERRLDEIEARIESAEEKILTDDRNNLIELLPARYDRWITEYFEKKSL